MAITFDQYVFRVEQQLGMYRPHEQLPEYMRKELMPLWVRGWDVKKSAEYLKSLPQTTQEKQS